MAENLRFPIVFDLEKGVEAAIKDWDGKYADKLEKAIQKRALNVKLKFDTKAFDNLDDVKRRLAELKITPLTPENKTAIRDLVRELKELARIMEKIQKFKGVELPELQMAKAAKLRKDVEQANEKMRLSQERVRQSEERLILSQQRAARQADRTSKAYGTQSGYLEHLIKKMAIYASFRQVGNFLTSVREVTAQFELQRVSLGAILQDANKGEQIFSQIKQFALKSPISILDLTKYTKQLAAYKIGYDELFDTTKRLADISVGLGVDFQRIVLLYGQVRATGYLRASEVRQATEAGIPLVEELAAKLTKANGELVTAADVMDMISKRAISFDMVKDVFTDMTSAGGAFYQMQEKQGNTLYGLWAKLGDAASVMYEQIGNTGVVNEGMKEAIQMLTELMRNWKAVGLTAATSVLPAVAAMAAWKMATKALAKSVATATSERIAAEAKLATAMKGTDVAAQNAARSSLAKAKADEAAAIAAQKNATAQSKLKMGFVSLGKTIASGLGIGIAVMLVTNLIYKLYEALTNFRKLKNELGSIYTETATLQDQSVRNFEFLANKAVKAASGSKEQTDALQELNRTYRDILPQEALTIENLAKMKGNYDGLTQSIREYIAEQQRQKAESAIMEYYGTKIRDNQNEVRERLYRQGLTSTEVGRFFVELERIAPETGKEVSDKFHDAMLKAGIQDEKRIAEIWDKAFAVKRSDSFTFKEGYLAISGLSNAYANQANELKGMNEQYRESIGNLGKFADMQKRVSDAVENATYKTTEGKPVDRDTQGDLLDAMKLNLWVTKTAEEIQNDEDIKKAFDYMGEGIKSEWFSIIDVLNSNDLGKVSQINFDAIIASVDSMIAKLGKKNPEILAILNTFRNYLVAQKTEYENMVPSETVVVRWRNRWRAIVKEFQISGQNMNRFLMQSSEDFEAYRNRIKGEVTAVINQINILNEAIKARISARAAGDDKYTKEQEAADKKKLKQAEERKKALLKLLEDLDEIEIESGKDKKGGEKSNNRLSLLKELFSEYKAMYDEYKKLSETLGADKAAAKMEDVYGEVAKQFEKYGLEIPMTAKKAADGMQVLIDAMEKLRSAKDKKGNPLFETLEKDISSSKATLANFNAEEFRKNIEAELKRLADRISRTKTAKEFYEKILGMTGDVDLAANLSLSIYGENGEDLDKAIRDNIQATLGKNKQGIDLDFSAAIRADGSVNYNALTKIAKGYLDMGEISEETYNKILKMRDEDRKDLAKTVEGWIKATEKAKTYGDKLADVYRRTSTEIKRIETEMANGTVGRSEGMELIAGYRRKEAEDIAKLQYDAFKDSPMYVQMFDDIDNASTTMLRNMKSRMESLQDEWKNLDPTQLKEMQSRLREIDGQLAKRNPFKTLAKSISNYRKLRREGDSRGNKSEGAANADLIAASNAADEARKKYDELVKKYGEGSEKSVQEVIDAKDKLDRAMANEEAAQKAVENWKKVKDMIGLSANELFQMLNWAGDITKGIADISEAMGADEEDVQYWNDMSNAIGQISGGIQDIVSAAMSGDVVGIISSVITAIPKMFVGITKLFHIGKIRKANKEIKRQQELLEQLEYTYGRLEKAAERLFGKEYLENYNQQLEVLRAQAEAYRKQAEAEERKGKEKDKEKIKEYEEAARETADKIQGLQDDLFNRITGTDVASAARDFAQSWLDAYLSFGSTTDAIKEKFQEMVKNMLVESYLAKTVQNALMPVFDMIDERTEDGELSEKDLVDIVQKYNDTEKKLDDGLRVKMEVLKKLGFDIESLRNKDGSYTGIAKNIAGATSEEINTAAAIGNTLMYYVSPIPRMDENLSAIRALMERGMSSEIPATAAASAGWTDWQKQAMDNYNAIQRNTAETVTECRRIAERCTAMASDIHKVIVPRGVKGSHGVQIYM